MNRITADAGQGPAVFLLHSYYNTGCGSLASISAEIMPVFKDEERGTYFVKCYYTDHTGARRQKKKRGFALKRDADAWEREFLATAAGSPAMPFRALCELFLEDKRVNAKAITYKTYRDILTAYAIPKFGSMPVNAITPAMLRSWQNELKAARKPDGSAYSPAYLNNIIICTSSVFGYAVRFHGLAQNPLRIAGNTAGHKVKSLNFWTKEEFDAFISTFDAADPYRVPFLVLYYCGVRVGELLALTAGDIDGDELRINKTVHMIDGERVVTAPKTVKSSRTVILPPFLVDELTAYAARVYGDDPERVLFPWGSTTIERHFREHIRAAGVRKIRLHDLRHSHASLLINLGASAVLVAERLGHENVSTTLNIYTHLFPSKQSEIAERLQEAFEKR